MKSTAYKIGVITLFMSINLVFGQAQLSAGGHAGNGEENKPRMEGLSQIPDFDYLVDRINMLEPAFPKVVLKMKEGIEKIVFFRHYYTNEKYNALSTFKELAFNVENEVEPKNQVEEIFETHFYENFFSQVQNDRLRTLVHELLHYVFKYSTESRYGYIDEAYQNKQVFEDVLSAMSVLIVKIAIDGDSNDLLKHKLAQYLSLYIFDTRKKFKISSNLNGDAYWHKSEEVWKWQDDYLYNIVDALYWRTFKPHIPGYSFELGGRANIVRDWNKVVSRMAFNPNYHWLNIFAHDHISGLDIYSLDWENKKTLDFLKSVLNLTPGYMKENMIFDWMFNQTSESYYRIDDLFYLRGHTNYWHGHPKFEISESQAKVLFEENWELFKQLQIINGFLEEDNSLLISISIPKEIFSITEPYFYNELEIFRVHFNPLVEGHGLLPQSVKKRLTSCDFDTLKITSLDRKDVQVNFYCKDHEDNKLSYSLNSKFYTLHGENLSILGVPRLVLKVHLNE